MKIDKILQEILDGGFPGKEIFEDRTGFDLYVDCNLRKLVENPVPGSTLKLGFYITLSELDLEEDFAREIKWMKKISRENSTSTLKMFKWVIATGIF